MSAFHKYEDQLDKVRFVGVHTGHLGFIQIIEILELDKLIDNLKLDTGAKVSLSDFECEIFHGNNEICIKRALNEATVKRSGRTMVADIIINQVHFERFRGDGISVSTQQEVQLTINR